MNAQRPELSNPFGTPDWLYLVRRHNSAVLKAEGLGVETVIAPVVAPTSVPTADATPNAKQDYTALVSQLMPVATSLLAADATRNVEVLKARVENFRRIRDRFPHGGIAWTLADNRLNVVKGKLKAAQKGLAREREDRAATKQWGLLGKIGLGVGILGGLALTVTILKFGGAAQRYKGGRP